MKKGLFSVIIVSYNQADLIYDCIDSILEQTYPQIELIIADDHSYDFDYAKLSKYIEENAKSNLKHYKIFTNEENLGIVKNCNKGCNLAQGEFLKSIAADDTFYDNEVFERMAKKLKIPQNGIVCARAKAVKRDGTPTNDTYPTDIEFHVLENLSKDSMYQYISTRPWCAIFAPGVFWRTDLFRDIGGYDESYIFTEDWPCWIRLAKAKIPFCIVNDFVIRYRYGGISNQSHDGMPNRCKKIHYEECSRTLLNEYATIKEKFGKGPALRCWYSAQTIQMKSVLEFDWFEMSFMQKLKYRIQKLPVLCYIKLMSAINYNKWFYFKKEIFAVAILSCALLMEKQLIPNHDFTLATAWITLILMCLVGLKIAGNIILFLLKKRAMIKTKMSGG